MTLKKNRRSLSLSQRLLPVFLTEGYLGKQGPAEMPRLPVATEKRHLKSSFSVTLDHGKRLYYKDRASA